MSHFQLDLLLLGLTPCFGEDIVETIPSWSHSYCPLNRLAFGACSKPQGSSRIKEHNKGRGWCTPKVLHTVWVPGLAWPSGSCAVPRASFCLGHTAVVSCPHTLCLPSLFPLLPYLMPIFLHLDNSLQSAAQLLSYRSFFKCRVESSAPWCSHNTTWNPILAFSAYVLPSRVYESTPSWTLTLFPSTLKLRVCIWKIWVPIACTFWLKTGVLHLNCPPIPKF